MRGAFVFRYDASTLVNHQAFDFALVKLLDLVGTHRLAIGDNAESEQNIFLSIHFGIFLLIRLQAGAGRREQQAANHAQYCCENK